MSKRTINVIFKELPNDLNIAGDMLVLGMEEIAQNMIKHCKEHRKFMGR